MTSPMLPAEDTVSPEANDAAFTEADAASTQQFPWSETAIAVAIAAVTTLWPALAKLAGISVSQFATDVVIYGTESVLAIAAGTLGVLAGRRGSSPWQKPWMLLGLGSLAWGLGNAAYLIIVMRGDYPPVPSWADIGYLAALPLLAAGVFFWPKGSASRFRFGALVDGVLCGVSLAALLWVLALQRISTGSTTSISELLITAFYPICDVVILMLLADALRHRDISRRRQLTCIALGIFSITIADLIYALISANSGQEITAPVADSPWIVGFTLLLLAAARNYRLSDSELSTPAQRPVGAHPTPETSLRQISLARISMYLATVALVTVVIEAAVAGRTEAVSIALGTLVLGIILGRQVYAVRENARLSARLQADIERLAAQAQHDALTGLPNRIGLDDRINTASRRSQANHTIAAVMFVDMDHLKSVNDSLGHAAGDILITTIANRLTARMGDRVTRFGGDEFVIVVDDLADMAALERVVDAVVADGSRPIDLEESALRPSVSVGVAVLGPDTAPEEALRQADIALYRSKVQGRQRSVTFHQRMDERSQRRISLEPELRRALDNNEFTVYFQPVVALKDNRLVGAEALLRWQHPSRGLIMPGEFLAEADASGLLGAIGERSLQTACSAFALANQRPGQHPIVVSVNLSASELQDRHVVARVGLALDRSKLPPELLAIEITEDVIINRSIRRTIDELIELGITLSIDDFGTGNSSLRQLGAYPASALKIDRSYISELDRSERGETVVRAIIGLADRFGMVTVAEGIERPSQIEFLHDLGCTAGQGWVFDRALPYEEFAGRHLAGPKSKIDLRGPAPQTSIGTGEGTDRPVSERDAPAQPLPPT